MKSFRCKCSNILYFENSQCLQCGEEVGYDPKSGIMQNAIAVAGGGFKRCGNGTQHAACNWLIPHDSQDALCPSCRLNQTIPDLTNLNNLYLWAKTETAKRRALYSLINAGLSPHPLQDAPSTGLAFQFLQPGNGLAVLTGHEKGLITINLEEADDAIRERNRQQLGEPYRTLLGHFRHELGHYYWDLWFKHDPNYMEVLPAFREVFGDETVDYNQAVQRHYQEGPAPDWQNSFVSAYASMHPWEDWAETWAHYLHMTDTLETSQSFGVSITATTPDAALPPLETSQLPSPFQQADTQEFLDILVRWVSISPALNEISRSLGQTTLYPFVWPLPAIKKLHFIHRMMAWGRERAEAQPAPSSSTPQASSPPATAVQDKGSDPPPSPSTKAAPLARVSSTAAPASLPASAKS